MAAGGRRVLIVEDDPSIRELVAMVLADEGYEARVAAGGREALDLIRAWRPELVLLDLFMGDMDGRAFLEEQRSNGIADIPVLVMTADGRPEAQAAALKAPVLSKPFQIDDLLVRVEQLLGA